MKMNKLVLSLTVGLFILGGTCYLQPSFAQRSDRERSNHACQREVSAHIQRAYRITQHGIDSRQINRKEAEGIRRNMRKVEKDFQRAVSDGRLSQRECERLNEEVARLYGHIKHDIKD